MKQLKEAMLTDHMDGFKDHELDYSKFEVRFCRWISGRLWVSDITYIRTVHGFV